ncbi:ectonucleotide pyrophosphatase/phosphodiesterase [Gammaproteobacteria bacterium]|nr:ectonucleotide pyrophosphatase/phosphodiesterase [Gammaproteobacteria bacterium]
MPFLRSALLCLLVVSAGVFAEKESTVIVISMDGVRHDVSENNDLDAFKRMEKNGVRAEYLIPVYQSTTYPAHVSLATGVYPDKHGILHNSFFDKVKGRFSYDADANWLDVPPIWVLAEQQNIRSAVFFWVGSETNWNNIGASYRKAPFDASIKEEVKIEQILNWLDMNDEQRPRLIMSYWDGTDELAHQQGPISDDISQQMARQNKLLTSLLSEIDKREAWDYVTIFVVSDHGMTAVNNYINLKGLLYESRIAARLSEGPAVSHLFLKEEDVDNAFQFFKSQPHIIAFKKEDLPETWRMNHPTRTGDIILATEAPNMFSSYGRPNGMHGYSPDMNDMHAIFYGMGAGIKSQQLGPVHQVDLMPTISKILGIKIPHAIDGKALDLN